MQTISIESELARLTENQRLNQRLGANLLAHRVLAWATKHALSLSLEQTRELVEILKDER